MTVLNKDGNKMQISPQLYASSNNYMFIVNLFKRRNASSYDNEFCKNFELFSKPRITTLQTGRKMRSYKYMHDHYYFDI